MTVNEAARHTLWGREKKANSAGGQTHFRLKITSEAFQGKMLRARHQMVYALLAEELRREGGVHALQLTTRTEEEEQRARQREGTGAEG